MMANTTIDGIQNELDYTRRTSVTNIIVKFIKPTNEYNDRVHSLGLIVVAKAEDATTEQYSVTRYWQNLYTNWLESEYLFDILGGPYDDFFLFDDYAIVLKD